MVKKGVAVIRYILFSVILLTLGIIILGFFMIPDEINSAYDNKFLSNEIYTFTHAGKVIDTDELMNSDKQTSYKVDVSIFNTIPIKSSSLTISQRKYVVVSGEIFGLRLFTDGVLIVGIDSVQSGANTLTPAKNAGLEKGDIIISINGEKIDSCSELTDIFQSCSSNACKVSFKRDDKIYETTFSLAYSDSEKVYKAGLWVRDSAAGIGTMTFFDQNSGVFAGLGHAVCDIDTGKVLDLAFGDIVNAAINGCYKGTNGKAGELCGNFTSNSKGSLLVNGNKGVYGYLDKIPKNSQILPVAVKSELHEGYAQILSTVDGKGVQYYDIEITKVSNVKELKSMTIKVTDQQLIEKTGGIVQGMSGSPIVQDGKLVGAVTHVFINDPTRGYGIFIGNMIDVTQQIISVQDAA